MREIFAQQKEDTLHDRSSCVTRVTTVSVTNSFSNLVYLINSCPFNKISLRRHHDAMRRLQIQLCELFSSRLMRPPGAFR